MPTFRELAFDIQLQQGDNWCWAAVAASISRFYHQQSAWTQCKIAEAVFETPACCPGRPKGPCDDMARLDRALTKTENLAGDPVKGPLSIADIIRQIDRGIVIGVLIKWPSLLGHFITIHGYDIRSSQPVLSIADPLRGKTIAPLHVVVSNYRNSGGLWSYSYFTRPNLMPVRFSFSTANRRWMPGAKRANISKRLKKNPPRDFSPLSTDKMSKVHSVFDLDVNTLSKTQEWLISKVGYRLIRKRGNNSYLVDYASKVNVANVRQIITDTNFVITYKKILNEIRKDHAELNNTAILEVFQVPELKIEFIRLRYQDDSQLSIYFSLNTVANFIEGRPYKEADVKEEIRASLRTVKAPADPLVGS